MNTFEANEHMLEPVNHAKEQAKAQLDSIRRMVAATHVDHDRLDELIQEFADLKEHGDVQNWPQAGEYMELMEQANGMEDGEMARQAIYEGPLSIEVRSGWVSPGSDMDGMVPEEFQILLCTGGPAVRIMGELDEYGLPTRAWLEYQDWGTPWIHYYEADSQDVLVEYSSFFFGG